MSRFRWQCSPWQLLSGRGGKNTVEERPSILWHTQTPTYPLPLHAFFLRPRRQDYDAAEEHYLKAINLHWRSPDAHYNLGCLLQHHKGDVTEAEKQYRHAIKCDPKHGMAQYNLGWVLEKVSRGREGGGKQ